MKQRSIGLIMASLDTERSISLYQGITGRTNV